MRSCKHFFSQLVNYVWNYWVTYIPLFFVRHFYFRYVLRGRLGIGSSLLMGVKIKKPKGIKIGRNSVVNSCVLLDGRGGLVVGNNVDIAEGVLIWTWTHDPMSDDHAIKSAEVVIQDDAWIGARSQILPGVKVGEKSVVGAGAVVTRDIEMRKIVAGVPARVVATRESKIAYTLRYAPWFE